ncbi:MAG: hypothetical protein HY778_00410 [Betaproteobacteria bacterium]|nr:hypothetical protein [Betaproteobacteria bacterium]
MRQNGMRRNIASLAARLMAEDGISDYGFAKRKAARQLGAPATEALPTNAEVELELRAWQTLYQADEQRSRLRHLRQVAVDAMAMLDGFRTYLTGPVLDGTAGRYCAVDLELYADDAKAVELHLLNRGLPYEHETPRPSRAEAPDVVLSFDWRDTPVRLAVYPAPMERALTRSPRQGAGAERARAGVAPERARAGTAPDRARASVVAAMLEKEETPP